MRSILPLLILILAVPLGADGRESTNSLTSSPITLEVILSETRLDVRFDGEVIRSYRVAIGKIDHPTPEGEFRIESMIWNPAWYPPDSEWAQGLSPVKPGASNNPMRVVKIPFDPPYYYIHGTDRPESIGSLASHGCIRMREDDVRELGKLLMQVAGEPKAESWHRALVKQGKSARVDLMRPVEIVIRMGEKNVYPGVVWALE